VRAEEVFLNTDYYSEVLRSFNFGNYGNLPTVCRFEESPMMTRVVTLLCGVAVTNLPNLSRRPGADCWVLSAECSPNM
jgi:hypothetical protein